MQKTLVTTPTLEHDCMATAQRMTRTNEKRLDALVSNSCETVTWQCAHKMCASFVRPRFKKNAMFSPFILQFRTWPGKTLPYWFCNVIFFRKSENIAFNWCVSLKPLSHLRVPLPQRFSEHVSNVYLAHADVLCCLL